MSTVKDVHRYVTEARLREDITTNARFGSVPVDEGVGRTVLTGTEANRRARERFVDRLEQAGLEVRVDAVGNIVGRWEPEGADPTLPAVASGSHLDSVPAGGIFDGVLGVYAALEAVRAIQEADLDLQRPIEVVCFTEEEGGRFSEGLLGSSVATKQEPIDDTLALEDTEGKSLDEALTEIGFYGCGRVEASEWDSWLELHIEQGKRLETADVPVGVVTAIAGTTRCLVEISGEANHAGTTSMDNRTDALAAASELVLDVETAAHELVAKQGGTVVGTVGQFGCSPNAINVIPGSVELGIDIRDIEYASMESIVQRVQKHLARLEAERGVVTTFQRPYDVRPTAMDERCIAALQNAAVLTNIPSVDLHSGAGHDTMHIAKSTDVGMLFAPSYGGFSHSPLEWTEWEKCTAATGVLATGLAELAVK